MSAPKKEKHINVLPTLSLHARKVGAYWQVEPLDTVNDRVYNYNDKYYSKANGVALTASSWWYTVLKNLELKLTPEQLVSVRWLSILNSQPKANIEDAVSKNNRYNYDELKSDQFSDRLSTSKPVKLPIPQDAIDEAVKQISGPKKKKKKKKTSSATPSAPATPAPSPSAPAPAPAAQPPNQPPAQPPSNFDPDYETAPRGFKIEKIKPDPNIRPPSEFQLKPTKLGNIKVTEATLREVRDFNRGIEEDPDLIGLPSLQQSLKKTPPVIHIPNRSVYEAWATKDRRSEHTKKQLARDFKKYEDYMQTDHYRHYDEQIGKQVKMGFKIRGQNRVKRRAMNHNGTLTADWASKRGQVNVNSRDDPRQYERLLSKKI